ncbi:MAG TPA: EamA family transporter [Solirubrobacteraceae bacterium]|nr:EamA family transporter [Solirubrobacteraceae bacterium]
MLAVLLALLASACWGVADFLAGLTSRRLASILVLLGQQAAGAAIAVAIVVAVGEGLPDGRAIAYSCAAGAAGALALGAFYQALAVGTMSVVAPISASGMTLPVAVGIASGDRPSAIQAAGLALTVAGVILAAREVPAEPAEPGAAPSGASRRSILLALLAALGFGGFFSLSDPAADASVLWLLVLSRTVAVLLIGAIVLATRPSGVPKARDAWPLALVGALDLAATGLYALANTEGLLSVVAVVGSLYPVATVLLARAVLHERLARVQALGVALAFAGVGAVAAG